LICINVHDFKRQYINPILKYKGIYIGDNGKEMKKAKTIQFKHENETWLRTLDYFQQENIFLKNRLAQIAMNHISRGLLNNLEAYQNKFINKDALIALIRRDIAEQEQLLRKDLNEDDHLFEKIIAKQEKLRNDVQSMEREFTALKFDFNKYLGETLK